MTRTYALKRLLEHGPMTPREICDCTRWTSKQVHQVLDHLLASGLIRSVGKAYEAEHV
jgi:DNA-binding MarR family transcriptional regulator